MNREIEIEHHVGLKFVFLIMDSLEFLFQKLSLTFGVSEDPFVSCHKNTGLEIKNQPVLTDSKVMATFTLKATAHAASVGTGTVLFPPAVSRLGAKASSSSAGSADNSGLLALMTVHTDGQVVPRPGLLYVSLV